MNVTKYKKAGRPTFERNFFNPFDLLSNDMLLNKRLSTNKTIPAVNISQDEDSFNIDLAAPGLKKENFDVQLKEDQLVISYHDEQKSEEKDDNYTRIEYDFQSFTRTFTLPEIVNEEEIKAQYVDGILHMVIQRDKKKLEARKIEIS